jgi:Carboxypeptidase regulatory-like domain
MLDRDEKRAINSETFRYMGLFSGASWSLGRFQQDQKAFAFRGAGFELTAKEGDVCNKRSVPWVLTVLILTVMPAFAQRDTASVVGTVRDASGALVPNATVTITNTDTNISSSTTTNGAGEYVLTPLRVGAYKFQVEASGFATRLVEGLHLNVDQRLRVDVDLVLQTMQQKVTVSGAPPALQTENATVGQVIGEFQTENLPLVGRNFQGLSALVPGAVPSSAHSRDSGIDHNSGGGVSLSGTRSFDNAFLIDGVDNSTNAAEMVTNVNLTASPNLDAIQEFKIQSSSFDAQYGRTVGGVINIVTKSGTNQLHGTAYDYLRNSDLNANSWQNNELGIKRGVRIRNQFGGVIGGPVVLPGYNGRDKTFFFGDYEGVRDLLPPGPTNVTVPDDNMRAGDFSEFLPGSNNNPCGSSPGCTFTLGAPYVNNVLPAASLDPFAKGLAALYPEPNHPGSLLYSQTVRNSFDENRVGVRIDHHFSQGDTLFGRYSYDYQVQHNVTWSNLLQPGQNVFTHGWVLALAWTHIIRPNLINDARFGYDQAHPYRDTNAPNEDLYQQLGLSGIPSVPGMPTGLFEFHGNPGIQNIGNRTGFYQDYGIVRDYIDNVTWIKGRHSLHFGVELRPTRTTHYESQAPRGDFKFLDTNATDAGGNPTTVGFAQFLTGAPSAVQFSTVNDIIYRQYNYAGYVQDNFRATQKLTLNLGMRYEYYTPYNEEHNHQATFDVDRGTMVYPKEFTGALPVAMAGIPVDRNSTPGLVSTDRNSWGPRFGFAYSINNRTVVRGGYGVYYEFQEIGPWSFPSPGYNPPFNVVWFPTDPNTGSPNLFSQGYSLNFTNDPSVEFQIAAIPAHFHTPRVQQWNLGVEREIAHNTILSFDYTGSAGHNLYTLTYFDQAVPGDGTTDIQSRQQFPFLSDGSQQTSNGGFSKYNAFLAKLEKRYSNGLSFLASYTWGHTLDNASDANLGSQHAGDTFREPQHLNWEYGNSDFDIRNRFVFSGIYDLPFGRGKAFGTTQNPVVNTLLGGWQTSVIWSVQSGYWYTPQTGNDTCNCNDGNAESLRPDAVSGQNPNSGPKMPGEWFNASAFNVNPPNGRSGNAGRNTILGPGFNNLDFGLHKDFRVNESKRFEFRAEFFDLFNHPNWDLTKNNLHYDNAALVFNHIQASLTTREIQLALKFVF